MEHQFFGRSDRGSDVNERSSLTRYLGEKLEFVQSPGLYSIIQRKCLRTESGVLGKSTSLSCGKVQDLEV